MYVYMYIYIYVFEGPDSFLVLNRQVSSQPGRAPSGPELAGPGDAAAASAFGGPEVGM